jgi:hypothetical protein
MNDTLLTALRILGGWVLLGVLFAAAWVAFREAEKVLDRAARNARIRREREARARGWTTPNDLDPFRSRRTW